ncbi:uncharacterized protein MELLADRAFT_102948 [Melampsora larici-populina 98AG31]|uniref:Uncharacterized protein n=1 Tax=Melampsora larici-populina (strain 98AG31 / pathotype 3-4-7) TaxID=747676 RepID=F4R8P2_MELLP|nr:uncharacterized protein MELLADRAFT_102948 [Melampsora larici-populina 98AG31]EGG11057.1 hypothetical protein MELLADRAFT_102948 [Melampsora larici-populina 98AG31]
MPKLSLQYKQTNALVGQNLDQNLLAPDEQMNITSQTSWWTYMKFDVNNISCGQCGRNLNGGVPAHCFTRPVEAFEILQSQAELNTPDLDERSSDSATKYRWDSRHGQA